VRVELIVNATASSVTDRKRVVIAKALAADHDIAVHETNRRGHATHLARKAARDGADVVVVLAGDGTLNEAANGLVGTETALAPLPGGSTNVFARAIGIADDPVEATGQLLSSLNRESFRRVGVGSVGWRRFLFHAGVGFDAAVVERVERRHEVKRYAAHPYFAAMTAATWLRDYDRRRPPFDLVLDDGERIEGCWFAVVSKVSPYTYLGHRPIVVTPQVGFDTPLSVFAMRSLDIRVLVPTLVSALRSPDGPKPHRAVAIRTGVRRCTVVANASGGPVPFQVDGDHLGGADRLEILYEPEALRLVLP
jgi:diacylglycerol kinase family enzyme